ncbi:unnamed protein product [Prorocentrum cordatum]|uniref:peptidylprolyl isomerase n=1 Tax=Prorocentrum cordatum TaxID=2364126 RepID=A0ABN9TXK0_9DINO|nr:unnamed protein product [Polarella glacialis]
MEPGEKSDFSRPRSPWSPRSPREHEITHFVVPAHATLSVDVELSAFRSRTRLPGNGQRPRAGDSVVARLRGVRARAGPPSDAGPGQWRTVDMPLATPELVRFELGGGEVIPGLEAAVAEMSLGECAEVTVAPLAAYGAEGYFEVVRPNSAILADVELLGFA